MSQPSGLPGPPSLCIQHGLESRALSANTPSQHKQRGGYVLRLAHQPILSCAIRPVLMSLWTHSYGIKVNFTSYSPPFTSIPLCCPLLLPSPGSSHFTFSPAASQRTFSEPCEKLLKTEHSTPAKRVIHKLEPARATKEQTAPVVLFCLGTPLQMTRLIERNKAQLTEDRKTNYEARYGETSGRGNRD